jgi:hypothetical protein
VLQRYASDQVFAGASRGPPYPDSDSEVGPSGHHVRLTADAWTLRLAIRKRVDPTTGLGIRRVPRLPHVGVLAPLADVVETDETEEVLLSPQRACRTEENAPERDCKPGSRQLACKPAPDRVERGLHLRSPPSIT